MNRRQALRKLKHCEHGYINLVAIRGRKYEHFYCVGCNCTAVWNDKLAEFEWTYRKAKAKLP